MYRYGATCLLLAWITIGSVTHAARGRSNEDRSHSRGGTVEPNVCDLAPTERAYCYCDNNDIRMAKDASCWVFSDCKSDDPIWDVFVTQPFLHRFKLLVRPDSQLDFIPTRAIRYLKNIKNIEIQYAAITVVPPYAFANSSTIEDISLTRNHIEKVLPGAFGHLPKLNRLTLDENRISVLVASTFEGAPSLTQLFVSQNNISVIEMGAFSSLKHLTELVLFKNSISRLNRNSFTGLVRLERLDLSDNFLTTIPDMAFIEMPELRELELERNTLESVGDMAFEGLSMLERLSLAGNHLTVVNSHALQGSPSLRVLDLRDNELRTLTRITIEPMMENLRNSTAYLLLTGNLFECDCRMSWVHSLHLETKSESVRNSLEELTCSLSGGLPGSTKQPAVDRSATANRVHNRHPSNDYDQYEDSKDEEKVNYHLGDQAYFPAPAPPPAASMGPPIKHLLEIAPELLPCPSQHTAPPVEEMAPMFTDNAASPLGLMSLCCLLGVSWLLMW